MRFSGFPASAGIRKDGTVIPPKTVLGSPGSWRTRGVLPPRIKSDHSQAVSSLHCIVSSLTVTMPEFEGRGKLPRIPDDMTLEEFMLDYNHELRPTRPVGVPWLVVEKTGRKVDVDEIRTRTRGLEAGVRNKFGIGEDDVVFILSGNHIDYLICVWAMHRLLASVSPCNPTFTASELVYQLRQTKPSLIITHADALATALEGARQFGLSLERVVLLAEDSHAKHPSHLTVDDLIARGLSLPNPPLRRKLRAGESRKKIAFLSPSSGTTGLPKIIALSHFGLIAAVLMVSSHQMGDAEYATWEERRYRPGDVSLGLPPLYHIFGIMMFHVPLFCGITVVVVPKFAFNEMLKSIEKYKINQLTIVPPVAVLLTKDPLVQQYDLTSVRVITCGGAPLSVSLITELGKLIPRAYIGQAYGQTEVTGGISMPSMSQKVGLVCGSLLPGMVARVVKPDGSLANHNEPGELYVKSPSAANGYWENDVATRETFVDGWARTGDLVMLNAEEEIVYIDRLKEIIKVNGLQVSPADLEGCLLQHSKVADVCVVGIPNEKTGEVPLAFVVLTANAVSLSQGTTEAEKIKVELMQHVAANKARYKHVARIEFIPSIPKNPSGKTLRYVLRDRARQLGRSNPKL
ncbi:amp dependent CoA ligase [Mycena capillaripes]|nr:amp dependent CoA ligase [Mycena capillaripes]